MVKNSSIKKSNGLQTMLDGYNSLTNEEWNLFAKAGRKVDIDPRSVFTALSIAVNGSFDDYDDVNYNEYEASTKKSQGISKRGVDVTVDGVLGYFETGRTRATWNELKEFLTDMCEEEIDDSMLEDVLRHNNSPTYEHDWWFEYDGYNIRLRNSPFTASTKKSVSKKEKSFNNMVNSVRKSGSIKGIIKDKMHKSSELGQGFSELRDCLLNIASYFYNVGDPISNQFMALSDEVYYLMQDLPLEKRTVTTQSFYFEEYEVPDSISEEFRLAKAICDDLLNRLRIENNADLRAKANEVFGKINILINATSKED